MPTWSMLQRTISSAPTPRKSRSAGGGIQTSPKFSPSSQTGARAHRSAARQRQHSLPCHGDQARAPACYRPARNACPSTSKFHARAFELDVHAARLEQAHALSDGPPSSATPSPHRKAQGEFGNWTSSSIKQSRPARRERLRATSGCPADQSDIISSPEIHADSEGSLACKLQEENSALRALAEKLRHELEAAQQRGREYQNAAEQLMATYGNGRLEASSNESRLTDNYLHAPDILHQRSFSSFTNPQLEYYANSLTACDASHTQTW